MMIFWSRVIILEDLACLSSLNWSLQNVIFGLRILQLSFLTFIEWNEYL